MRQDGPNTHHSFPGFGPEFLSALDRLSLAVRRPAAGQHAGDVRSRQRGRALEFADYRPYSQGDDPKLVDWRAYARTDRLYLKQYQEERSRTLTLLVDASGSMNWGDGDAHKGLYARRLAAALAWVSLGRHEPVRTFLLRDGSVEPLPPAAVRSGAGALFGRLGEARESGVTGLAASLRQIPQGRAGGPVVLLSDLMDPDWEAALEALAARGEVAVVQLLSPAEWEPPLGEEVDMEDAETGEVRPTRLGPQELAVYRGGLETMLSSVRAACGRLGLIHLALNSGEPIRDALFRRMVASGILAG